jgi:hypothetical protein
MEPRSALGTALARVVAPLGIGALTYLARGGDLPRGARFFPAPLLGVIRPPLVAAAAHVPRIVTDTLPDAAWAFAVGSLLAVLWPVDGAPRSYRIAWLAAGALLAAGWELAQGLHLVPGTFDVADLAASALAYLAALVTFPSAPSKENPSCVPIRTTPSR